MTGRSALQHFDVFSEEISQIFSAVCYGNFHFGAVLAGNVVGRATPQQQPHYFGLAATHGIVETGFVSSVVEKVNDVVIVDVMICSHCLGVHVSTIRKQVGNKIEVSRMRCDMQWGLSLEMTSLTGD